MLSDKLIIYSQTYYKAILRDSALKIPLFTQHHVVPNPYDLLYYMQNKWTTFIVILWHFLPLLMQSTIIVWKMNILPNILIYSLQKDIIQSWNEMRVNK